MVGLLTALPRTPLYERLSKEGRLLPEGEHADNTRPGTNFVPKRMDYEAMVEAYKAFYRCLVTDRSVAERIRNKTRFFRHPVHQPGYSLSQGVEIIGRFITRGLLPGGPIRWYHFLRTLTDCAPRVWPVVIQDWIAGLTLRDYVKRYFIADSLGERRLGEATLRFIRKHCAACLRRGTLEVALGSKEARTELTVTLRGSVDSSFFSDCARRLETLLQRSTATLTLHIDELSASQRLRLERLLRRLGRYGDQVSIRVSETLRPLLPIDSSVFHLVLD